MHMSRWPDNVVLTRAAAEALCREFIGVRTPALRNLHIETVYPSEPSKSRPERHYIGLPLRSSDRSRDQNADFAYTFSLLRPCRERPGSRAPDERD